MANEVSCWPLPAGPSPCCCCRLARLHPLGQDAAIIGEVIADDHHFVQLTTAFGGAAHCGLAQRRPVAAHLLIRRATMRILLLSHAYNSLTQRLDAELRAGPQRDRQSWTSPTR